MKYIPIIFAALLLLGACRAKKSSSTEGLDLKNLKPFTPKVMDKKLSEGTLYELDVYNSGLIEFIQKEKRTLDSTLAVRDGKLWTTVNETRTGGKLTCPVRTVGTIKVISPYAADGTTLPILGYELKVSFDENHPDLTMSFFAKIKDKEFKLMAPFKYGAEDGEPAYSLVTGEGVILLYDPRRIINLDTTHNKNYVLPGNGGDGGSGGGNSDDGY
jgi:hypothetical protein